MTVAVQMNVAATQLDGRDDQALRVKASEKTGLHVCLAVHPIPAKVRYSLADFKSKVPGMIEVAKNRHLA